MNVPLPRQSPVMFAFHCVLVLLVGFSLYCFLHSNTEKTHLLTAVNKLKKQNNQLQHAEKMIQHYGKFLDANSFYKKYSNVLKWEEVSETWDNLAYNDFMHRLSQFYKTDRPFVLEKFSISYGEDKEAGKASHLAGDSDEDYRKGKSGKRGQRFYHIQGFFLCPCS